MSEIKIQSLNSECKDAPEQNSPLVNTSERLQREGDLWERWFLSFDCGTKTFAFSLCQVVLTVDTKTRLCLKDVGVVDLFPHKKDKNISPIERIRAVTHYVRTRVSPMVSKFIPSHAEFYVLVENQMSINPRAKTVADCLVSIFIDYDVRLVHPSLKNKVAMCDSGLYEHFANRYKNPYTANKEHTKFNYAIAEKYFSGSLPPYPVQLRGHIADSFMQILGFLQKG